MPGGPTAVTEKSAGVPGQTVVLTGSAAIVGVIPPHTTLVVSVTELSDSSKSFLPPLLLQVRRCSTPDEPGGSPRRGGVQQQLLAPLLGLLPQPWAGFGRSVGPDRTLLVLSNSLMFMD